MKTQSFILLLPLLVVASCHPLGPDYSPPGNSMATTWKEGASQSGKTVPKNWWKLFGDSELNSHAETAIRANHDLQLAAARVRESRALARYARASSLPSLTSDARSSWQRGSQNRATTPPGMPAEYEDHISMLDLDYELDLWGRVRRSNEAAKADSEAVAADRDAVQLAVTAETARHYFLIRATDNELAVLEQSAGLRRESASLMESRAEGGLADHMDASRAQAELADVEAEIQSLRRSRAQLEHALAVLCGHAPSGLSVAPKITPIRVPDIPVGMPSSLLQRRPDIRSAGESLHAAVARTGVAKADFFPRIRLTGSGGFASADLGSLLESPAGMWSLGPSVTLPVFDGGRNRANLQASEARADQARSSYQTTVLIAFREVEDALSDLRTLSAELDATLRSVQAAKDTATLAEDRYGSGITGYLDVVDAQRAVLNAERRAARLGGQQAVSTILLAKALGGGWKP